jgi:MscS family membrane protein
METLITKVQRFTVIALAAMLMVVMVLSTVHLGVLIGEKIWEPPRWLIAVQGLLEIFGYFLLVLIGVELLETLKAYLRKDVIHVRVVLEVALIAMARKVIVEEPNTVPGVTLFGIAALILALGIAFFFERQAKRETGPWDFVKPGKLRSATEMFLPTKNRRAPSLLLSRKYAFGVVLAFFLLAGLPASSRAQLPKSAPPTAAPAAPLDPLRRETPRSTAEGLAKCGVREDFACAARYLQPPPGQQMDMQEVARELQALRSGYKGNLILLSEDPNGAVEEGLPPGEQRAGVVEIGGATVDVILVRVDDPKYGKIWLVSSETVAKVPQLYAQMKSQGPTLAERVEPAALRHHRLLGMSVGRWLGWLISIPISWLLAWVLAFLLSVPRRVWLKLRRVSLKTIWETELGLPIKCIMAIVIHGILVYLLEPPLLYRLYYFRFLSALLVACFAWLVGRIMDRGFEQAVRKRRTTHRGGEAILILVQRVNRIVLLIIAIVAAMAMFGVNVKTTLAGLGIGGLAIALGAQKTLENVIGGVSLLMDKAVQTGDFCEIGGKLGTVEDIGLRSLSLRTLDQNLLVVPNSALAQMQFQNMKARSKLLISQNFSLRIETSVEQLRTVLNHVQQMLNEHPAIESGTSRIRVADFAGAAFEMELWAYATTGDWVEFTAIRQDVILKIAEIVEAGGVRFAAPTRLTYLSRDAGNQKEETKGIGIA